MLQSTYSYRNLDVWEDSQQLAADIVKLVQSLPNDLAAAEIARQLVRAAGSTPANIPEGHGRYSLGAYRNHLLIARGSAGEVGSWLDLLKRADYISAEQERPLSQIADSLLSRLLAKARSINQQLARKPKMLRDEAPAYHPNPDSVPQFEV